jgi:hypothetical protein
VKIPAFQQLRNLLLYEAIQTFSKQPPPAEATATILHAIQQMVVTIASLLGSIIILQKMVTLFNAEHTNVCNSQN